MNNNYLQHHGVLGMKWGVRKSSYNKNESDKMKNAAKKAKRKKDLKNRRILSEKELEKKINRLKMEKQLKDLTEADVKPGRTAVKKFISSTGGKVITAATVGGLTYAGKYYVSKQGNVNYSELANYMFPNPNKKK